MTRVDFMWNDPISRISNTLRNDVFYKMKKPQQHHSRFVVPAFQSGARNPEKLPEWSRSKNVKCVGKERSSVIFILAFFACSRLGVS